MWGLDLYRDRNKRDWVQGVNSSAPAILPAFPRGDTVQLRIHELEENRAQPRATVYSEIGWGFTSIRAALGLIDAAPHKGSFKLRVDGETTDALEWPADLSTPALLATWKATVLAALEGLANVGAGEVTFEEPDNTPENFFYPVWTDIARTDEIEVVSIELTPLSIAEVLPLRDAPAFQQLVKIIQAPIVIATDFEFPDATQPTVVEERAGGADNAVQTLTLPTGANGALELSFTGSRTRLMALPGVTPAQLAAALNAIPVDGETNPSFEVTGTNSTTFTIEFIGPEAASAQALLGATIRAAAPPTVAIGDLAVTNPRFAAALNGLAEAKLKFEVVITDAGGETKIIREVKLIASMTGPGTIVSLEEANAVITRTETVYIDTSSSPAAIATVAPGIAVVPGAAASNFIVAHDFASWQPDTRVAYKISTSPEHWVKVPDNEYEARAVTVNSVRFTFAYTLSADTGDPLYFGNFKFFILSPDATVQLLEHEHPWAELRESLPAGQTLVAKLAALDAALGIFDGSLRINASQIEGLLAADQIDVSALAAALRENATFLETLRALATDALFADAIGAALVSSANFLATFKTLLADPAVLAALVPALLGNSLFSNGLRTLAIGLIRGTAGAITDAITFALPDWDVRFPSPTLGTLLPLPKMIAAPTDLGTFAGYVPRATALNAGKKYTIGAAGAILAPNKGKVFVSGDVIYSDGLDWFLADIVSTKHYAKEFERELFTIQVNEDMLSLGTRFSLVFSFSLALAGNCEGYYRFTLERGTANADVTDDTNLSTITVDETVLDIPIVVTDAATMHTFGYAVERSAATEEDPEGVLSATKQIYTTENIAATAPGAPKFTLQARLSRVDTQNVASPRGQFTLTTPAAQLATIVRL